MIPIQELLSRSRRGPELGRGKFIIGDYDRIAQQVIKVPLAHSG